MSSDITGYTGLFADTVSVGEQSSFPSTLFAQNKYIPDNQENGSTFLTVEISDAISRKEDVIFTIRTKTNIEDFRKHEFKVNRVHEDFLWLHDQLTRVENFACFIIPPPPPRSNFDASRATLQRLANSEGTMTNEDMQNLKVELEAQYLATFKKTVAMHEVFIQRIASHPIMSTDYGFRVFLEYEDALSVRTKNTKEKAFGIFKSVTKSADEALLLSSVRDEDPFFLEERSYIQSYINSLKEAYFAADSATRSRQNLGESFLRLELIFKDLITTPPVNTKLSESVLMLRISKIFGALYPLEIRRASDEDLKLSDTLLYYLNEAAAAKDLMYRRNRALANYLSANRALDRARTKNRDLEAADVAQSNSHQNFEIISLTARGELENFKIQRVNYFRKNIIAFAELQIKHVRTSIDLLRSALESIKEVEYTSSSGPESRD